MMASNDRILVSTEEMRATVKKYEDAMDTLHQAYDKIETAKEHLDRCYKGPGYVALTAKMLAIYANVKTADIAIDETIEGLNKTIQEYEQLEQRRTDSPNNVETGPSYQGVFKA